MMQRHASMALLGPGNASVGLFGLRRVADLPAAPIFQKSSPT